MKKIRWGVLSTAQDCREKVIPATGSELGSVVACLARSAHAKDVATKLSIERAYGSYDELLSDPNVDAVYIRSATHARALVASRDRRRQMCCARSRSASR
jgi:predicted dehydrogenase